MEPVELRGVRSPVELEVIRGDPAYTGNGQRRTQVRVYSSHLVRKLDRICSPARGGPRDADIVAFLSGAGDAIWRDGEVRGIIEIVAVVIQPLEVADRPVLVRVGHRVHVAGVVRFGINGAIIGREHAFGDWSLIGVAIVAFGDAVDIMMLAQSRTQVTTHTAQPGVVGGAAGLEGGHRHRTESHVAQGAGGGHAGAGAVHLVLAVGWKHSAFRRGSAVEGAVAGRTAGVIRIGLTDIAGYGKRKQACPNDYYAPAGGSGGSIIHKAYLFTVNLILISILPHVNYKLTK